MPTGKKQIKIVQTIQAAEWRLQHDDQKGLPKWRPTVPTEKIIKIHIEKSETVNPFSGKKKKRMNKT